MSRIKGVDTQFVIKGSKYNDIPQYYHWDKDKKFPYYEELNETKTFIPPNITSLDEAELWLLENEPEYYFGASICEEYIMEPPEDKKEPLDFCFLAIPSYYENIYDTNNRKEIIKMLKKEIEERVIKPTFSNIYDVDRYVISEYEKYDVELNASHFDIEVVSLSDVDLLNWYAKLQYKINGDTIMRLEEQNNGELLIVDLIKNMKPSYYSGNLKDFFTNLEKEDKSLCRFLNYTEKNFYLIDGESTCFFDSIDNYENYLNEIEKD